MIRRALAVLVCAFGLAIPLPAQADEPCPKLQLPTAISAKAWMVADLDTGDVLATCAPHAKYPPASTQKLLTVLTALPKVDPRATVTVTEADLDFEPGSSAVGLVENGRYTVETVILGLLLNSGNDAANVIARLAGRDRGVLGTIADMNATAKSLGALDTIAVTPSGLDAPGQVTSAHDLAVIARAAFHRDDFRRYVATPLTTIPAQKPKYAAFQIQNDNQLLFDYPGAIGGKTGFTDLARHTFAGAAERGGRRLVVTMLRGEHLPTARMWQQGAALLDWGFANPTTMKSKELPAPVTASPATAEKSAESRGTLTLVGFFAALGIVVIVAICYAGIRWLVQHGT